MTVTGNCNEPFDEMVLTVDPEATADAGPNATVCEDQYGIYQLDGTATNGTIMWETSGDGLFNDATLEDPTYTFGTNDRAEGTITLTMTVTGNCNAPSDDMIIKVERCSEINLSKETVFQGTPTNAYPWTFELYLGPDGYGDGTQIPIATETTTSGVGLFDDELLSIYETYTVCEKNIGAGWGTEWKIDVEPEPDGDGVAEKIIIPYNPDEDLSPSEDNGHRCFDFGANTAYPLLTTNWSDPINPRPLVFSILNDYPGGSPRTPGYWKNWSTCSGGGQVSTAEANGGPDAGWYILDDILSEPGITWGDFNISTCEEGVSILDQRDLNNGKKMASDAAYTLAMHLLAYQLNQGAGAKYCQEVADWALKAEIFLIDLGFNGTGRYLSSKTPGYSYALMMAEILDTYNNSGDALQTPCEELAVEIALIVNGTDNSAPANTKPDKSKGPKKSFSEELESQAVRELETNVYPYPFVDRVYFEVQSPKTTDLKIEVYTMTGSKVETIYDDMIEENVPYRFEFDGDHYPGAMYIYRITTPDEYVTGKLLRFR